MSKLTKLPYRVLRPDLSESFKAGYESIWRKAQNIKELISPQQPQGPSMETWIKGSVQRLFTFPSLFLHHQVTKAFITSAATAPLLPADGEEVTSIKKKEEAVLQTGAVEQLVGPTLVLRSLHMILFSGFTQPLRAFRNKQPTTTFLCAACT